jgi:hypothetical protein
MLITFHSFSMGDVDDVDVYAAQPIYEWQQTDQGKWAMQHAQNLTYHTAPNLHTFGYRVVITGDIDPGPQLTEYLLKWPKKESL